MQTAQTTAQTQRAPTMTALSGNEIYCMHLKGFTPLGICIGNSIQSMGFLGSLGSSFNNALGGEITQVTRTIHDGRVAAFARLVEEAKREGAAGVVGVSSDLRNLASNTEFLFVGTAVTGPNGVPGGEPFTSAGDAQELYCHMDAGYMPLHFVFGNIAYSIGVGGNLLASLRTLVRGEVREYSDMFNATRHLALSRLCDHAREYGANAVVGIRTNMGTITGAHEMYMTGTAAFHRGLAPHPHGEPVTSDLTGEELWSLASMGYMPIKQLIATSVYSLGAVGQLTAMFKGLSRGEIPELTSLIYEARENVFDRMQREASALGAEKVVGIKTHIVELGQNLIEILAVGTAVKRVAGIGVATAALPAQAIIRDKNTWTSGSWDIGVLNG